MSAKLEVEPEVPDMIIRKIREINTSPAELIVSIPRRWAEEMSIMKGSYVQLDLSATRQKITIRPVVVRGVTAVGEKRDDAENEKRKPR
jgi:phosphate uptake regulator